MITDCYLSREYGRLAVANMARARKAERERDEADRRTAEAEAQRDQWKRHHARVDGQWAKAEREVTKLRAAQPRPLTADDITDSHVLSARLKAGELGWFRRFDAPTEEWRTVLTAALTEPPARPEGAEEIEDFLRGFFQGAGDVHARDLDKAWLADQLAEVGLTPSNPEPMEAP